ncbi:MAG TPA: nucleotidyltransferase domain-containing protein [Pseudonocardiaceae bacterium]
MLIRLVRQGIVYSDKVGNAFTYRLNRDHLAAEYIIGLANLQMKLLKRIEDRLESWTLPPVYAAVFGSAARGSMTADSDLDLLLIQPDDADDALWETQVNDLTAEVTRWTGNDTQPLEFTASDLAARGRYEPVLSAVLDHGLTVAGTHSWFNKQLRKR